MNAECYFWESFSAQRSATCQMSWVRIPPGAFLLLMLRMRRIPNSSSRNILRWNEMLGEIGIKSFYLSIFILSANKAFIQLRDTCRFLSLVDIAQKKLVRSQATTCILTPVY